MLEVVLLVEVEHALIVNIAMTSTPIERAFIAKV